MDFREIETKVIQWAMDRNLFYNSNPEAQLFKLKEELNELEQAISKFNLNNDNRVDIIDAIGDMLVVLTIISYMYYIDLTSCYNHAYKEIKDRKGSMINGLFVKE